MTTSRAARTLLTAVLAAAALVSAGCGNKHEITTEAETEGIWVDVGPLDYHVQGSRVLEEGLLPDRSYLAGLPAGTAEPTGDEVWFAVFMRIENQTDEAVPTAREFEIHDTEGKTFTPFGLDPEANPFAYEPLTLEPNRVVPVADSAQEFNSFSGAELLFKLPLDSYQNRPLELVIHSGGGEGPEEARISLDV
jgi:hypothetical protein